MRACGWCRHVPVGKLRSGRELSRRPTLASRGAPWEPVACVLDCHAAAPGADTGGQPERRGSCQGSRRPGCRGLGDGGRRGSVRGCWRPGAAGRRRAPGSRRTWAELPQAGEGIAGGVCAQRQGSCPRRQETSRCSALPGGEEPWVLGGAHVPTGGGGRPGRWRAASSPHLWYVGVWGRPVMAAFSQRRQSAASKGDSYAAHRGTLQGQGLGAGTWAAQGVWVGPGVRTGPRGSAPTPPPCVPCWASVLPYLYLREEQKSGCAGGRESARPQPAPSSSGAACECPGAWWTGGLPPFYLDNSDYRGQSLWDTFKGDSQRIPGRVPAAPGWAGEGSVGGTALEL